MNRYIVVSSYEGTYAPDIIEGVFDTFTEAEGRVELCKQSDIEFPPPTPITYRIYVEVDIGTPLT